MNVVLIILLILLAIVAFILLAAAFTSKEYTIEREIIINKPKDVVFDYIKLLKNQDYYSKWVMTDPNMKKDFKGVDGTVGFVYAWDSENKQVGKGEQEITGIIEDKQVNCVVRFIKPFEGTSNTSFVTNTIDPGKTGIRWIFSGMRNYPAKIVHMLFNLKKVLGKDMEVSLSNLKNNLER